MGIPLHELQSYKKFDELAGDILDLAKEILPDQLIFLSSFSNKQQIILKLSDTNTDILLTEGMAINLNETVCNRVDFEKSQPLIYEDISKESCLDDLKKPLAKAHINSYLGIPISLGSGERFGTLCAVHQDANQFDRKSIHMLQKIARMFSYYLELERLAFRDSLTGLYNRQYLHKFFGDLFKTEGAFFFLDLDGFKRINDLYGHDTGDRVLKEVALRIQQFTGEQNHAFAVRLGGDEFVINVPQVSSKAEISKQAERLLTSLHIWDAEIKGCKLSASIGIAPYPAGSAVDLKTLLQHADHALYCAKAAGKNTYKFF